MTSYLLIILTRQEYSLQKVVPVLPVRSTCPEEDGQLTTSVNKLLMQVEIFILTFEYAWCKGILYFLGDD